MPTVADLPPTPRGRAATVDLGAYDSRTFDRGAGRVKELCWLLVRWFFFTMPFVPSNRVRTFLLRRFGARVGRGLVIRSGAKIKFPWRLTVGDNVWIGEEAEVLNLAAVTIGDDVCISQRAFLCTGNHDYRSPTFALITEPIRIESGAWLGAMAFVGPGVTVRSHAVLTAGSAAIEDLPAYTVNRGNPAAPIREREIGV